MKDLCGLSRKARDEMKDYQTAKYNIDRFYKKGRAGKGEKEEQDIVVIREILTERSA